MLAKLKYLIILFLWTGMFGITYGQFAGANAKLGKSGILIGDQVKVELTMTAPAGSQVQWPLLTDTLARFVQIVRKSGIDTVSTDKQKFTLKQDLIITSFDSGSYVIKPIIFKYKQKGDTTWFSSGTLPQYFDVQTIKTDQAADIKPIKPPLKAPITFREILPWILLVLGLAGAAVFIYFYLKRKKKVIPVPVTRLKTSIPPYEAAMEALETLKQKKLWQSGRVKDYYSELTEIVREYIELRYPVRAMEMTTAEIRAALKQTEASGSSREKLDRVLVLADLVKFAKEQPLPLENEQSLNHCVEFVRETKPGKDHEPVQEEKEKIVEQN
jgi:hypothetical protein